MKLILIISLLFLSGSSLWSAPVADPGAERTLRTGVATQITAAASTGSPTAWLWELGGDCPIGTTLSADDIEAPTLTIPSFGQCSVTLTVTDAMMASDDATVIIGAVPADASGNVDLAAIASHLPSFFGKLIRYGASPWPYSDRNNIEMADFYGGRLTTHTPNLPEWETALAGTIAVTESGTTITGTGTAFQTDFCGGDTTPDALDGDNSKIVVWVSATDRRDYNVVSCDSQTSMTISSEGTGYMRATASGLQYARWRYVGTWINGSNNVNYYDNVMAFYSLYYRTGMVRFRDFARDLADSWWSSPSVNQGTARNDVNGNYLSARVVSLTGLMLRALDGQSGMWDGIKLYLDRSKDTITARTAIVDIREDAYDLAFVSFGAIHHPTEATRDTYIAAITDVLDDVWEPLQQPDGNWVNLFYGVASWNGQAGTMSVTNGSATVTGSGTSWSVNDDTGSAGNWFLVCYVNPPASPADCDSTAYEFTINSSTSITLASNYAGTTNGTRYFQFNNLVGFGSQPFQMGIVGTAMSLAYRATADVRARQFTIDTAVWLKDYGYYAAQRGLFYNRGMPCEPDPSIIANCNNSTGGGSNPSNSRFLNGEVLRSISEAYLLNGAAALKTFGDDLFSAALGADGGTGSDASYALELDDYAASPKPKNFGFFYGFGNSASWPAATAANVATTSIGGGVSISGGATIR